MGELRSFFEEEDGVTVVEIVLILTVLVGLVVIFKSQLSAILIKVLGNVTKSANSL